MRNGTVLAFLLLLTVSGCRVGPRYETPFAPSPEQWKNPHLEYIDLPKVCFWWEIFQDDTLNELEAEAVANNHNLRIALANIEQAWAVAGISRADLFPQLNLNQNYTDTAQLFEIFLPNILPSLFPPGVTIPTIYRIHQLQYAFLLKLSYQVDLWGKYRSQYESAAMNAEAQEEAYQVMMLSLTCDLASSYYNLRTLDSSVDLFKRTVDNRGKDFDLTKSRYEKGLVNKLDFTNAESAFYSAESDYYDAVRQRGLQENMIATLIGRAPSDFTMEPMPLKGAPPIIPAGIPSSIVERRPDIREAEREMASQHKQINVAVADFFPSFDLTGTLGYLSPDFKQFMNWKSRFWSVGGGVGQTVFDGGRKSSNLEMAWSKFTAASESYQQQVLTALQQVEDALNDIEFEAKQVQSLGKAVRAAQESSKLSSRRYMHGLVNYFEVTTNEQTELNYERTYIGLLGLQYQSTVQLIQALGGSWD